MKKRVRFSYIMITVCMAFMMMVAAAGFGWLRRGGDVEASANGEKIDLPIIMYHSLLKDASKQNEYVLSPDDFACDLAYLRDHGYTAITARELAEWVYGGTPLPAKPVMITFDDAHLNTMTYGLPLLRQHGMKAVVSVVGEYTERSVEENDPNPAYAYLNWDDIRELANSGCFEIGNHTFSMHSNDGARKGIGKKRGEDEKTYSDAVSLDLLKLQDMLERNSGVRPIVFAYPFGYVDDASSKLVKQLGFRVSLGCMEKINRLDQNDPDGLYNLGRFNRPAFISTEAFMKECGID